jgi:hypothetical protein
MHEKNINKQRKWLKNFIINEEGYLWHFDFQLFVFFKKYYKELLELCA